MYNSSLKSRLFVFSQSTAVLALTGLLASCSADASRFDELLTASTRITPNQQNIIRSAPQPYPGDATQQGIQVAKRAQQTVASTAETAEHGTFVQPVARQALNNVQTNVANVRSNVQQKGTQLASVYTPQKPAVTYTQQRPTVQNGQLVLQPRQQVRDPLRINNADTLSTGSVAKPQAIQYVASQAPAEKKPVGWKNPKGTWVTVKPGETLFNLSRRYGVPVQAILTANQIQDGNNVAAGRRILIPTYHYSNTAPISAPDSDPVTKASRSTTGFQGQAIGRLTVPKHRQQQVVTRQPEPQPQVRQQQIATQTSGSHLVQSGDTLYGIARRYNVSAQAIVNANNMSDNTVRLGQRLTIPGGQSNGAVVAKNSNNIDYTTTASIPNKPSKIAVTKPKTKNIVTARASQPAQTQNAAVSSGFRWPVTGRLIGKFGERKAAGVNDGIDISVPIGTPIRASEGGKVIYSGAELEDFGKLILVSHDNGWVSAYAHANNTLVRRGDVVRRGQVIAKSGRSGNAQTPRLHFELRKNSNPVNPLKHLAR